MYQYDCEDSDTSYHHLTYLWLSTTMVGRIEDAGLFPSLLYLIKMCNSYLGHGSYDCGATGTSHHHLHIPLAVHHHGRAHWRCGPFPGRNVVEFHLFISRIWEIMHMIIQNNPSASRYKCTSEPVWWIICRVFNENKCPKLLAHTLYTIVRRKKGLLIKIY